MSRPLTADEILAALKRWGITYHETPSWRTRHNGSGWGDVQGFLWHHTGDDAADDVDLRIVRDGRAGLPGPLCQFGLRDDGSVDLVAAGAANHAGGGDPLVLAAVSRGNYGAYPPKSRYAHGQAGSVGGNAHFYGVETYYSGTHKPTGPVARTMPLLAAAIIDALDRIDNTKSWSAKSAIGHKEWQRGKVDPGNVDCATLRTQTQELLDTGETVALTEAEMDRIAYKVWAYDQKGAKPQAWGILQAAALPVDTAALVKAMSAVSGGGGGAVISQPVMEAALKKVLGSLA